LAKAELRELQYGRMMANEERFKRCCFPGTESPHQLTVVDLVSRHSADTTVGGRTSRSRERKEAYRTVKRLTYAPFPSIASGLSRVTVLPLEQTVGLAAESRLLKYGSDTPIEHCNVELPPLRQCRAITTKKAKEVFRVNAIDREDEERGGGLPVSNGGALESVGC
jgi:hypothetical protein